jgi:hypothetical protein
VNVRERFISQRYHLVTGGNEMSQVVTPVGKSAADVAPVSGPAGAEKAIGTVVIKGDPCLDIEVFNKLVDAVSSAFYEARHKGVVRIGFRFEDGVEYFILTQPFGYDGLDYAVVLDEDRRPLYVVDHSAMTWDDAVGVILYHSGARERPVLEVQVEVGERW